MIIVSYPSLLDFFEVNVFAVVLGVDLFLPAAGCMDGLPAFSGLSFGTLALTPEQVEEGSEQGAYDIAEE